MKKRIMMVMTVAVLVIAALALVACGGDNTNTAKDWKGELNKENTVVIGYTNNAPMGITNDDKTVTGFDIELANKIFAGTGVKVETKLINWGSKENELNSNKIDLVWNGLTANPEREANMELSKYYLMNEQAVVVKSDAKANYTNVASLAGKKIAVENGSAGLDALDAIMANTENITKNVADSQMKALLEVKAGQSDVAIIDSTMAGYLINKEGSDFSTLAIVTLSDTNFEREYYSVAAKKGKTQLIGFINEGLIKAQENKDYETVAKDFGLTSRMIDIKNTAKA